MPHLCALEAWREGGREGVKHWAWLSQGNEGELAFISAEAPWDLDWLQHS